MRGGCRACGAPISVEQFRPLPCAHCGTASPLTSEDETALRELAHIVESRAATVEQWERKVEDFGRSFGSFELFGAVCLWLVVGGTLIGLAVSELPSGGSLIAPNVRVDQGVVFARWLVTLVGTALGASAVCATAARWYGRQQVFLAAALPPLAEGAAPRCRRCGATLPKGDAVRRCSFCHADSIVEGALLVALRKAVKNELSHMRVAARRSLQDREVIAVRLRNALFVPPFLLLVTFPIFWFVDTTPHPIWMWTALICAPLCVLVFFCTPKALALKRVVNEQKQRTSIQE